VIDRLLDVGVRRSTTFLFRLAAVALRDPVEALEHVRMHVSLAHRQERARPALVADSDWRGRLHADLGLTYPCEAADEFAAVWRQLADEAVAPALPAAEMHDADAALAEAVWCVVRHLAPTAVVETGVSRGVTSRVVLEALQRNGHGRLWSVDLPPIQDPWRRLAGSAVPRELRDRWEYVRGSSRRRLPQLVRRLGDVDVFVHDSLHTPLNFRFELETVWPHLRPGGFVVVDDAEDCDAVAVVTTVAGEPPLVFSQESKGTHGVLVRKAPA
jgi:Methyltransferase domain